MSRILIIDDDEQIRSLLRQMLERAGHEIIDASNGVEGMHIFRAENPDLVITDLIMPEKEGIETLTELRREFPTVPVIAMSGGGRLGTRDYLPIAKQLGARRTIAKPFSRDEMLEAVKSVLAP